jgi:hypothetical protein
MKGINGCKEYKELVMEAIDGLISKEAKAGLDIHVKNCPDCRKYLKNMQKIRKAISKGFETPLFLETRIMAHITGKAEQPAWQINFRPVLNFAVSFGLVMIISLFIIYKSFDNKTVIVADMPVVPVKAVAVKPVVKTAPMAVAAVPEIKAADEKPAVNTASNTVQQSNNASYEEHGPSIKLASNIVKAAITAPKNDVVKTGEAPGLVMLKPGVNPTTTNSQLLDRDFAIVANNLINPMRGEYATITIKVVDPANVKIIVYDKSVRPISKILDAYKDRGTYEATWEGRTDNGETVSDGVYFVYIQIGTRVIKKSIIVNK